MRTRAKCGLCKTIIEAKGKFDYVSCACGEISIDCATGVFHANIRQDKSNLILIDEEGNEIVPKEATETSVFPGLEGHTPKETAPILDANERTNLLNMLDDLRENIERLPKEAMQMPVTHADFSSLLVLLSAIFRAQ